MKKIFAILFLLAMSCEEIPVTPTTGTGRVVEIGESKTGQCVYFLEVVSPYAPPSVDRIETDCGKYAIGDIVKI